MRANDVHSTEANRHGAYLCFSKPADPPSVISSIPVQALANRMGLRNEFEAREGHPSEAIAFLRRKDVRPADIADNELMRTDAVVHVASPKAESVTEFCVQLLRLLNPAIVLRVLRGVLRPMNYTGNAMHNYAYAHRIIQQPAAIMPNAFLVPMNKTTEWWKKDWMERHTYFLPRYGDSGHMLNEGHALAAAAGIECLMRRTYKSAAEPALAGAYDFTNYFECADAHVPTFYEVCAALRDVRRNPEWKFVREGPTWHGRRVATWADMFE
jgi:hypothetical protein